MDIRKTPIKHKIRQAHCYTCRFHGNIKDYAMMWLNLTNNAREYPEYIYSVQNDSLNGVYIYTPDDDKANREWFENLGLEIIACERATCLMPYVCDDDFDYERYPAGMCVARLEGMW